MHYSTGKSRHLGYIGKPISGLDSATAQILLKKGVIAETLLELFAEKHADTEQDVQHPDIIPQVVIEVRDIPKVERKQKDEKKVKPKRNSKKVTKK